MKLYRLEATITQVEFEVDENKTPEGRSKRTWEAVGTGPRLRDAYAALCGNGLTDALSLIADPDA